MRAMLQPPQAQPREQAQRRRKILDQQLQEQERAKVDLDCMSAVELRFNRNFLARADHLPDHLAERLHVAAAAPLKRPELMAAKR